MSSLQLRKRPLHEIPQRPEITIRDEESWKDRLWKEASAAEQHELEHKRQSLARSKAFERKASQRVITPMPPTELAWAQAEAFRGTALSSSRMPGVRSVPGGVRSKLEGAQAQQERQWVRGMHASARSQPFRNNPPFRSGHVQAVRQPTPFSLTRTTSAPALSRHKAAPGFAYEDLAGLTFGQPSGGHGNLWR